LPAFGLLLVGALRAADVRADVPDPSRVALLSTIDIFAPLAQPALEQLARRLTPLRVPEEAVVMAEGDVGDRFYVIVDGEAVIRKGGRDVARVGPGAYVGEIALLRDVPRTATVVAATPLELLGLDRDEFLAAVSVTRRSSQTADATVRRRLAQLGGVVESEP
jgi:CRP-like cAMP-binding protein